MQPRYLFILMLSMINCLLIVTTTTTITNDQILVFQQHSTVSTFDFSLNKIFFHFQKYAYDFEMTSRNALFRFYSFEFAGHQHGILKFQGIC